MIFGGSYADSSVCDWQSMAAAILYAVVGLLCWWACAWVCAAIGEAVSYPATGAVAGAFGIPILGILINGWRSK